MLRCERIATGPLSLMMLLPVVAFTCFFWLGAGDRVRASAQKNDPPNPPVVWLHYDYMVGADGHSHAPITESITKVVQAFRDHGITLHIDPQHTAVPETPFMAFNRLPFPDTVSFFDLKGLYFHPNPHDSRAWHYVIFGHYVLGTDEFGDLARFDGYAEIGGYNFMIGMGTEMDSGLYPIVIQDGGVFMHELGHNFGLLHGGDDGFERKPNYLSVMNALFVKRGIPYAAAPGSTEIVGYRYDYSGDRLAPLDESHLDENGGISAGSTDITRFIYVDVDGTPRGGKGPATGPIDWDHDGVIALNVTANINFDAYFDGSDYRQIYSVLTGFDDWSYVDSVLRTPQYVNGAWVPRGDNH